MQTIYLFLVLFILQSCKTFNPENLLSDEPQEFKSVDLDEKSNLLETEIEQVIKEQGNDDTTGVRTGDTTGVRTEDTADIRTGDTTGVRTGDTTGVRTGDTTGVRTGVRVKTKKEKEIEEKMDSGIVISEEEKCTLLNIRTTSDTIIASNSSLISRKQILKTVIETINDSQDKVIFSDLIGLITSDNKFLSNNTINNQLKNAVDNKAILTTSNEALTEDIKSLSVICSNKMIFDKASSNYNICQQSIKALNFLSIPREININKESLIKISKKIISFEKLLKGLVLVSAQNNDLKDRNRYAANLLMYETFFILAKYRNMVVDLILNEVKNLCKEFSLIDYTAHDLRAIREKLLVLQHQQLNFIDIILEARGYKETSSPDGCPEIFKSGIAQNSFVQSSRSCSAFLSGTCSMEQFTFVSDFLVVDDFFVVESPSDSSKYQALCKCNKKIIRSADPKEIKFLEGNKIEKQFTITDIHPNTIKITDVTIRDFNGRATCQGRACVSKFHPSFDYCDEWPQFDIVQSLLGSNGKPQLTTRAPLEVSRYDTCYASWGSGIFSKNMFDKWFSDSEYSVTISRDILENKRAQDKLINFNAPIDWPYIELTKSEDSKYKYKSESFLILDNNAEEGHYKCNRQNGCGNTDTDTFFDITEESAFSCSAAVGNCPKYNWNFTVEAHTYITYLGNNETFSFASDEDLWIFLNGKLVVDLGGFNYPRSGDNIKRGSVTLDASTVHQLGLTKGQTYPLDIFFAERSCCRSIFEMETSIQIVADNMFTHKIEVEEEFKTNISDFELIDSPAGMTIDTSGLVRLNLTESDSREYRFKVKAKSNNTCLYKDGIQEITLITKKI
jgi:fibro-slime domain-containing protein